MAGERTVTVLRGVKEAELDRKAASRQEKHDRKRVSDAMASRVMFLLEY